MLNRIKYASSSIFLIKTRFWIHQLRTYNFIVRFEGLSAQAIKLKTFSKKLSLAGLRKKNSTKSIAGSLKSDAPRVYSNSTHKYVSTKTLIRTNRESSYTAPKTLLKPKRKLLFSTFFYMFEHNNQTFLQCLNDTKYPNSKTAFFELRAPFQTNYQENTSFSALIHHTSPHKHEKKTKTLSPKRGNEQYHNK